MADWTNIKEDHMSSLSDEPQVLMDSKPHSTRKFGISLAKISCQQPVFYISDIGDKSVGKIIYRISDTG